MLADLITFAESVYHQARSGWISSVRKRVYLAFGRVYHQCGALYRRSFLANPSLRSLHQTAGKYTLTSDDIQPKGLMRYTLKRDDMPNLRFG